MNWLCRLMSVYLLFLSFLPCGDGQDTHAVSHESASISLQSDIHPEEHHADLCSPFCACSCCGVTTPLAASIQVFHSNNFLANKAMDQYLSIDSHSYLSSIYRPPASLLG